MIRLFHHIQTTWDYIQYSVVAVLHTLQFIAAHELGLSVFTRRILTTDLWQSHCHFKTNMESYFRSLITFLPLLCSCQSQRLDSIRFQAHIPAGWLLETWLYPTVLLYSVASSDCVLLQPLGINPKKNTACIIDESWLPCCCLAIDVLLSRTLACAGMCLPSRCLAVVLQVTIYSAIWSLVAWYIVTRFPERHTALFSVESGGSQLFRNIRKNLPYYRAPNPRRQ
jgi:hypothetical protein